MTIHDLLTYARRLFLDAAHVAVYGSECDHDGERLPGRYRLQVLRGVPRGACEEWIGETVDELWMEVMEAVKWERDAR